MMVPPTLSNEAHVSEAMQTPNPKEALTLIDCDLHHNPATAEELFPYLPQHYIQYIKDFGLMMPRLGYTNVPGKGARDDLWNNTDYSGPNPSAQPSVAITRHLDPYKIDYGILTGGAEAYAMAVHNDPDYANAICRAFNDYTAEHWLAADNRLRGSIHVSATDPQLAAQEIHRLGPKPEFVQVMMPGGAKMPFGNRYYHPIYEACAEYNLPLCSHFGGEGAGVASPPTPVGYPTYYLEMRMARPLTAMAHTVSLICEGVFEKFPNFKVLFIEQDFFWISGLMWHMDQDWKGLKEYTPWVKKLPSDYIRGHIRVGSQPMPDMPTQDDLKTLLRWVHADEIMVYASDYPHWDWDEPSTFLQGFDPSLRQKIMVDNARGLYDL